MVTYTVTGDVNDATPVSIYALMVPVLAAPGPVRVKVVETTKDPVVPAPFRMLTVAVWTVLSVAVSVNVILSNQSPPVRALLTLLLRPFAGNVAAAEAAPELATTPKPSPTIVMVHVLVWQVPISPEFVVGVMARLAAWTPPTL